MKLWRAGSSLRSAAPGSAGRTPPCAAMSHPHRLANPLARRRPEKHLQSQDCEPMARDFFYD